MKPVAFIATVDGGKREFALYDDVCNIIGKQILASVTDKRCSRYQAELTFSSSSNEAVLTVVCDHLECLKAYVSWNRLELHQ